ncbi:circadian clock-controlled protein daywake [Nilaparvata lugens]|uniref:circadian clock-controlled protein daywake n=1 Tax=Nilaparvata lugens TaxID=108931 RepID=UPI00193D65D3|nr:circadian clock-controlled protein daywake [Nilaparvata lugens]
MPLMEVCYRDDPNLNKCIKDIIQHLVPNVKSGIPELGLPSLDPMEMDDMEFTYKSSMVSGDTKVKDVKIYKLSNIKVVDARAKVNDPTKLILEFEAHYDRLESIGKYELVGNIARIPINTQGLFNLTLYDVTFMYTVKGDLITGRDGEEYMELKHFQYLHSNKGIGNLKLHATNLVEKNAFLNMFAIRFLNQFWKPISRELIPIIDPMIDRFTTRFFNNIFLRIPYNMLFPQSRDWMPGYD